MLPLSARIVAGVGGAAGFFGACLYSVPSVVQGGPGGGPGTPGCLKSCGAAGDSDCCASPVLPGGSFARGYDAVDGGSFDDAGAVATVSSFRLDAYEVTVGRFRSFVAAYPTSRPAAGAGKNPNDPTDPGWDPSWTGNLAPDASTLLAGLQCDATYGTWTPTPGASEAKAMNCISWYEAFAFCIWDHGRLPTEAEWNYAAAGGSQQRVYPWSVPPTSAMIDPSYAVYGGPPPTVSLVGLTSPKGDGAWGQADLAGNVLEWVVDSFGSYPLPCSDCANREALPARVQRGGSFVDPAASLRASVRASGDPGARFNRVGVRCARSP